ncbi:hypothetical protein [Methylobacterium oryzisoli]|uniref:hypothetical protein n=1 Tax=Methylobacterium oryzisoli TaxID=3385502 RepID=UPI003891F3E6
MLAWAWRTAIVVALLSVAATHFLAGSGPGAAPQGPSSPLAALRGAVEPETTGAIGPAGMRLDPCALDRRR